MKHLGVILIMGLLCVACDSVESQYPTLKDAKNDRLFERGWLPDILPGSARGILTAHNLDLNTSEGRFSFDPADFEGFSKHLKPYSITNGKDVQKEGYINYEYSTGQSVWIFSCNSTKGHCEYKMRFVGSSG